MPGETSHEIGRAYVYVFAGCLERAVKGFSKTFDVYTSPAKLTFTGLSGAQYSFDLSGVYQEHEVFIESKGYQEGTGLLEDYKSFLAKAYCTSLQAVRYRDDQFWFVTNVPFGSSFGRRLWSPGFVLDALRGSRSVGAAAIIGGAPIDESFVSALSQRIAVGIFTDSFIAVMGTRYKFQPGDTLWSVIKLIHGGRIPLHQFEPIELKVQHMNDLQDANKIRSGQRINLPWYGVKWPGPA